MAAAADRDSLFGDSSARGASGAPSTPTAAAPERRISLKPQDQVATQVFNPNGTSTIEDMSLKQIWKDAARGNKWCAFHTELAASDSTGGAYRVGIGLSRFAETTLAAIAKLKEPDMARIVKQEILAKVLTEAGELEPHLQAINAGKGGQAKEDEGAGFQQARKRARLATAPSRTKEEVEEAAQAVYDWLGKQGSPLRAMLHYMGAGGAIYAAGVADKVTRAWKEHCPATTEDAQRAAWARASEARKEPEGMPDNVFTGLF